MKVEFDLEPLTVYWLHELISEHHPSLEAVFRHLCECAVEGIRREGSWEAGWLEQAFGDVGGWPSGVGKIGWATVWERPQSVASGQYPAGWVSRVVRGDFTVAYDGGPFPTRDSALRDAQEKLRELGLIPVEEVIA